jgi:hypothetical protein
MLERSGILVGGDPNEFYYQTIHVAIQRDGDVYRVLDVLAREVGSAASSRTGRRPSRTSRTAWASGKKERA